eukprot:SAG31_NODE_3916_length_3753_cov_2.384131_1_plen_94_part_00
MPPIWWVVVAGLAAPARGRMPDAVMLEETPFSHLLVCYLFTHINMSHVDLLNSYSSTCRSYMYFKIVSGSAVTVLESRADCCLSVHRSIRLYY